MRKLAAVLASVAILLGAVALLRTWLDRVDRGGLSVEATPGPGVMTAPVTLRQVGPRRRAAQVEVDGRPVQLAAGSEEGRLVLDPDDLGPGLHVVSWDADYLGRPPRQATFAWLAGPFRAPGQVACAVRLTLGEEALERFGQTLESAVTEAVESIGGLPRVNTTAMTVKIVEAGIDATAQVEFEGRSSLRATLPLRLDIGEKGALRIGQRGPVEAEATGSVGTAAALKGGGLFAGLAELFKHPGRGLKGAVAAAQEKGAEETSRRVQRSFAENLPEVNARLARAFPRRLRTTLLGVEVGVDLAPCGAPRYLPGRAAILRYDARPLVTPPAGARPPEAAGSVEGPVAGGALPHFAPPPREAMTVAVSEDLVNAFLDAAWRSGGLAVATTDPAVVGRLNARLAYVADVRVERIALPLPPVIGVGEGAVRLGLGEVTVDLVEADNTETALVFALDGGASASVDADWIAVDLQAGRLHASCSRAVPGGVVRHPCFPDLVDALSDALHRRGSLRRLLPGRLGAPGAGLSLTDLALVPGAVVLRGRLDLVP